MNQIKGYNLSNVIQVNSPVLRINNHLHPLNVTSFILEQNLKKQLYPFQLFYKSAKLKQRSYVIKSLLSESSRDDDFPRVKSIIKPSSNVNQGHLIYSSLIKKNQSHIGTILTHENLQEKSLNKSTEVNRKNDIFPVILRGKESKLSQQKLLLSKFNKKKKNNSNMSREHKIPMIKTPLKNKLLVHILEQFNVRKR